MMKRLQMLTDRVFDDEPVEPFDYEPEDLALIDADEAVPDVGDDKSGTPPP